MVEYVAPRFHTKAELDPLYASGTVRNRVLRVRPSAIGAFTDTIDHAVVFAVDGTRPAVFSEPRFLEGPIDLGTIVDGGFDPPADTQMPVNDPPPDATPLTLGERLQRAQELPMEAGAVSDALFDREPTLVGRVTGLARVVLGAQLFVVHQTE